MYYVFRQSWSPTDQETIIVRAETEELARQKIRSNARYIDVIAKTQTLI